MRIMKRDWPVCVMCCERLYKPEYSIKQGQCNWCTNQSKKGWASIYIPIKEKDELHTLAPKKVLSKIKGRPAKSVIVKVSDGTIELNKNHIIFGSKTFPRPKFLTILSPQGANQLFYQCRNSDNRILFCVSLTIQPTDTVDKVAVEFSKRLLKREVSEDIKVIAEELLKEMTACTI